MRGRIHSPANVINFPLERVKVSYNRTVRPTGVTADILTLPTAESLPQARDFVEERLLGASLACLLNSTSFQSWQIASNFLAEILSVFKGEITRTRQESTAMFCQYWGYDKYSLGEGFAVVTDSFEVLRDNDVQRAARDGEHVMSRIDDHALALARLEAKVEGIGALEKIYLSKHGILEAGSADEYFSPRGYSLGLFRVLKNLGPWRYQSVVAANRIRRKCSMLALSGIPIEASSHVLEIAGMDAAKILYAGLIPESELIHLFGDHWQRIGDNYFFAKAEMPGFYEFRPRWEEKREDVELFSNLWITWSREKITEAAMYREPQWASTKATAGTLGNLFTTKALENRHLSEYLSGLCRDEGAVQTANFLHQFLSIYDPGKISQARVDEFLSQRAGCVSTEQVTGVQPRRQDLMFPGMLSLFSVFQAFHDIEEAYHMADWDCMLFCNQDPTDLMRSAIWAFHSLMQQVKDRLEGTQNLDKSALDNIKMAQIQILDRVGNIRIGDCLEVAKVRAAINYQLDCFLNEIFHSNKRLAAEIIAQIRWTPQK